MTEVIRIGPVTVEAGRKKFGNLIVGTMADGAPLFVPVHVLAGSGPGPKLCVVCAQHGDENAGNHVARQLVTVLDPKEISGTLVVIPVANPPAFEAQNRFAPVDGANLNRVWPGNRDLFMTERIADIIAREVVSKMDFVIDIHSGEKEMNISYIYSGMTETFAGRPGSFQDSAQVLLKEGEVQKDKGAARREKEKEKREFALTFGMELLLKGPLIRGTLDYYIDQIGVRGITAELGYSYGLGPERIKDPKKEFERDPTDVGVTGVKNIMKRLGMLEGKPKLPEKQVEVYPEITLKTAHGGMLLSELDYRGVHTVVPKGTLLGRIVSAYSFEELERLVAPLDETVILGVPARPQRAFIGGYAFVLSDWKTAEWINN